MVLFLRVHKLTIIFLATYTSIPLTCISHLVCALIALRITCNSMQDILHDKTTLKPELAPKVQNIKSSIRIE